MMGRHRVRALVRDNGIRPVWKHKFIHMADSHHTLPITGSVLNRQIDPTARKLAFCNTLRYISLNVLFEEKKA